MIKKTLLYFIVIINVGTLSFLACQTNEIGIFIGESIFHGDVGKNINSISKETGVSWGFTYKRNFDYYFSICLGLKHGEIFASDQNSHDPFKQNRNLSFKSNITEFSLISELNFRPYLSRNKDVFYTPYLFAGLSKFLFNPRGRDSSGTWHNLMPLGTEGQQSGFFMGRPPYKLNGIAIPLGFGYKIRVLDFLTLIAEIGLRVTFTDYLDDVSTTYVDDIYLDDLASELADKSSTGQYEGFQRGNPHNKDKFGFFGISIFYSIKDPKKECNHITL